MVYDVTIGIPFYHSAIFIRQALESALLQTYESIEIILVDDGSEDGSLAIILDYIKCHCRKKNIRIISHESNMGVSASRNHIIEEAQGDYLYFLDSDDVLADKDVISLMIQNIRQYDAEIVFGSYEKIETSGQKTTYMYPSVQLLEKDALANFAYRKYAGIQASSCNYLVKTSVLRDNHLKFIDADYWEDFVFTFDLVTYISRAVLLPNITYLYICREHSLSHYQNRETISKAEILQNVQTIDYLKQTSSKLSEKTYYPDRCLNIMMTDFFIACNVLKRRKEIEPPISDSEIKEMLNHPASFSQILSFKKALIKNMAFYFLTRLPSFGCVGIVWLLGKMKKFV